MYLQVGDHVWQVISDIVPGHRIIPQDNGTAQQGGGRYTGQQLTC